MAGGSPEAWDSVKGILADIAAKSKDGRSCCARFGTGGAGHFVKMAHNAIEYGYMGVLAELYQLMRDVYGMSVSETREFFARFAQDPDIGGYLVEITADILAKRDDSPETGHVGAGGSETVMLIDRVHHGAGNKGTGRWASEVALKMGIPISVLTQALYERYFSVERRDLSRGGAGASRPTARAARDEDTEARLKHTLRLAQYICFEQGLRLIEKASEVHGWDVRLCDVLSVWEAGCIIRTQFLPLMREALSDTDGGLFASGRVRALTEESVVSARRVVCEATEAAAPVFCLGTAVAYYDGLFAKHLPTTMIQAQRDYFGAHGYRRIDIEGNFHSEWKRR
jgi:6-phosphogluconate dehydrogenase